MSLDISVSCWINVRKLDRRLADIRNYPTDRTISASPPYFGRKGASLCIKFGWVCDKNPVNVTSAIPLI